MTTSERYMLWLVAAASMLIIAFAPQPSPTELSSNAAEAGWSIAKLSTTADAAQLSTALQKSKIWGSAEATNTSIDDRAKKWRIAGITGTAGERVVLVQFGDDKMISLKSGDRFPDETRIAEIRINGICVILDGKRRFLPLDGETTSITW